MFNFTFLVAIFNPYIYAVELIICLNKNKLNKNQ